MIHKTLKLTHHITIFNALLETGNRILTCKSLELKYLGENPYHVPMMAATVAAD